MDTLKQPLTKAQLELLSLFNRPVDDTDWSAIRRMITRYFAEKAIQEADTLWQEKEWNEATMTTWLNSHQRTQYHP